MAKLRVNKIAAVGVSTETTGSVFFDGSGDHLAFTDSTDYDLGISNEAFSLEFWFYKLSAADTFAQLGLTRGGGTAAWNGSTGHSYLAHQNTDNKIYWQWWDGSNQREIVSTETPAINTWHHLAIQYDGTTTRGYLNGIEFDSATQGYAKPSSSNITRIGQDASGSTNCHAYISNLRVCKGHQVYNSNFTPPTEELDVHSESILLVCHDGENIFADKTGRHTGEISAIGDRLSSPTPTATDSPIGITTFQPGLDRDVDNTFGPTFQGGVGYNSQNWLTLPKGTTTERNQTGGRGIFGGGTPSSPDAINYITISSMGNILDFGDLSVGREQLAAVSSQTRGVFGGGNQNPGTLNTIDYITIAATGNAVDFGDLTVVGFSLSACSSATRGVFGPRCQSAPATFVNTIDYITIASIGNAVDFGDSTDASRASDGCASPTRGLFGGGRAPTAINVIEYITIASTGNAIDFGDLTSARDFLSSCSSATRGLFAGGPQAPSSNVIDYVTISTLGNASDFGDLTAARCRLGATSSPMRAVFAGGDDGSNLNTIDYVEISTTGNAKDFGELSAVRDGVAALSDSHGGLS